MSKKTAKEKSIEASVAAHHQLFLVRKEEPPAPLTAAQKKRRGRPNGAVTRGNTTFKQKRIRVLSKGNPKQPGTAAHETWKLYRDGMTTEEYYAHGGKTASLKWDSEREFIRLEPL